MELIVRVLPMFVFLPIVMSSGSVGAGSVHGCGCQCRQPGCFFLILLENPLVSVRSSGTKGEGGGAFVSHH
jgi:hypothetical protein